MREKNPRADKVQNVSELQVIFQKSSAAFLTEYRGLTVAEISTLRGKLRKAGGKYHVVKNTLFRRALGDQLSPELNSLLKGPTAIAFAGDDPVSAAKTILDFVRDVRKPDVHVKGGYMDGKIFSADQVIALSKIPPRDVVLSQTVGTIQAPLSNFVGTMHGVLSEFARTLQALADQHQGETA
jgi:large subunit ribosomal protein L10